MTSTSDQRGSAPTSGEGGSHADRTGADVLTLFPESASAVFSRDSLYRYALWRRWGDGPIALFVGLNPSTADESQDDPTIRRCVRFARDWGYGALCMANLFAWRSTDPNGLAAAGDPVGPDNDVWLSRLAEDAGVVIAAWGTWGVHRDRARQVIDSGVLGDFSVLGLTKDGHPRHPLYMLAASVPVIYQEARA